MSTRSFIPQTLLILGMAAIIGCAKPSSETPAANSPKAAPDRQPSAEGAKLILASMPEEHQTVIQARETVKDGDEVAVLGRIGGSTEPWVEGRAAFQIVDPTLVPCNEKPGDSCTTPWDYCCDTDRLPKSMATVKFVDASGKTLETDARQLLGLKELQSVVIKGKAQRDEAGNLTVLASNIFVQKGTAATTPHDHAGHDHDHGKSEKPAATP